MNKLNDFIKLFILQRFGSKDYTFLYILTTITACKKQFPDNFFYYYYGLQVNLHLTPELIQFCQLIYYARKLSSKINNMFVYKLLVTTYLLTYLPTKSIIYLRYCYTCYKRYFQECLVRKYSHNFQQTNGFFFVFVV